MPTTLNLIDEGDPNFHCPWCDYVGMQGLFHMRREHPREWREQEERRVMAQYAITRKLEFDAGHRIYGHESKCAHLHGHRYQVHITCQPKVGLDGIGRVVDFGVVKQKVGNWIDDCLDHVMLLWADDPLAVAWDDYGHLASNRVFEMEDNPTAENIAKLIYKQSQQLLADDDVEVTKVVVWETPNCNATYEE